MKKLLSIALSAVCCVSFLAGCETNNQTPAEVTYYVTFVQSGAEDVVQPVKSGADLTELPTPKAQKGYTVQWENVDLTNITKNITVNAIATPNTYTITYQVAQDEVLTGELTQDVTYDATYELKTPSKTLYKFLGWSTDQATIPQSGTWTIDSNVTLTARWDANFWTVTFLQDGEENIVKTVEKGAALTDIPTPNPVDGYNVSWNVTDFSSITENMTVTVQKDAKTFNVSYELASGETMADSTADTVTFGESYTLKTPEKAGYNFVAWKDKATGKTIPVTGDEWQIASNVTLQAEWATNNNTVTFIHADGTTETREITTGQALTDIPAPKQVEGYTVTWDRTNFTNITGATTVNAVKTANKYTVVYADLAGGTMTDTTDEEVTFGASYTLGTPVRYGYTFVGWLYETGKTVAASGEKWAIAKDVTLTAVWENNFYTITFIQDGFEEINVIVQNGDTLTEGIPTPQAVKGYTVEWNIKDFSQVTSSQVVHAVKTAKTYTITYKNLAGGTMTGDKTLQVAFGADYVLSTPTRSGYTFDGWKIISMGTKIANSGTYEYDTDLELEATWKAVEAEWTKNY